jgi:hypothetical protein
MPRKSPEESNLENEKAREGSLSSCPTFRKE